MPLKSLLFTVMEDFAVPTTPGRNTPAGRQASQLSPILLPAQAAKRTNRTADIQKEESEQGICRMRG